MNLTKTQLTDLQNLYSDKGNEVGGYITNDGAIVVCDNYHVEPDNNFTYSITDLDKLDSGEVWATFHTHIGKSSNLSKEDYDSFQNWAFLIHFIIGDDGVSCYRVTNHGSVVKEEIEVCS